MGACFRVFSYFNVFSYLNGGLLSCFFLFRVSLCPFVPYVNVFFHILACFLASYVNFVVYIFVLSLHVLLV